MASPPVTHILDKNNYASHALVPLNPAPSPPTPLPPSTLRLRTRIIGLTTNNLTYARMGHLVGWWGAYPLPTASLPPPYNDTEKYGRISAWGYAEVLESTVSGIDAEAGATLYGYLPISTEEWTLTIDAATGLKDVVFATDAHRKHLWNIYNRYVVTHQPLAELEKAQGAESLGLDASAQPLFGTAYNMNVYGFAWEDENRVHPSGHAEWTAADADLKDAVVISLNASGKTGLAWAYTLRNDRPAEFQPKAIIGVGSSASKDLLEKSGLYDRAALNGEAEEFVKDSLVAQAKRVVIFEFGARAGTVPAWCGALAANGVPFTLVVIGAEVKAMSQAEVLDKMSKRPNGFVQANADVMREKGIALSGDKYFEQFNAALDKFKAKGGFPGVELQWGQGLEEWEKGWEALCQDKVPASKGLVYRI